MTLAEAMDMLAKGETPEQHQKRQAALRRYVNERDALEDAIEILTEPEDAERRAKKEKRLAVVLRRIEELK